MNLACLTGISPCTQEQAAKELARHINLSDDTLEGLQILLRDFALIPRTVQPMTESGDPIPVFPANKRLTSLHEHNKSELREILQEAGHPV